MAERRKVAPEVAHDPEPAASHERRRRGEGRVVTASLALIVVICWFDYLTGSEIGFSLFYLAPVVACGWWAGSRGAAVAAGAASVAWYVADAALRAHEAGVTAWNGFTRLVIFLAMGVLVARVQRDQERLADLARRLQIEADREARLARTDPITGLANSRAFLEILAREVAAARAAGGGLSLAYLDLDNFKRVNDRHGHVAGNDLLCRMAGAIAQEVRAGDVPARVGGDEFAVVARDVPRDAVDRFATRLLARVNEIAREYPDCDLGVSIGVATCARPPEDGEEVLRRADAAMYEAKRRGKGRVVVDAAE